MLLPARLDSRPPRLLPVDSNDYTAARIAPEDCKGLLVRRRAVRPAVQVRLRDQVATGRRFPQGWPSGAAAIPA
jgi:hypothetical protein